MGINFARGAGRDGRRTGKRWATIVHRSPDKGASFVASPLGQTILPDGTVFTGSRAQRRARLAEARREGRRNR